MISIVTPVLNGAKFIEKNIESIKMLEVPFEHIIVDGGSTDETLEIVSRYPHLKVLHQNEKTGMYGAIDMGFKQSKYELITWVNCDDWIITRNYARAVNLLNQSDYDMMYGDSYFFWQKKNKCTFSKASKFYKYFLSKGIMPFLQPSCVFRKSSYNSTPLRYHQFKLCGDLDLFMRMVKINGFKLMYINEPLICFLKYGESLSDRNRNLHLKELQMLQVHVSIFDRVIFKLSKLL